MSKAVVLFSGGQDSTTCLAWAMAKFGKQNVSPVSFDYGQRHIVERDCAQRIAAKLGVSAPYTIPVPALSQFGGSALTNSQIKVEMQATQGSGNPHAERRNLPSTFVPGRNLIFLSLAAAYGAQRGAYNLVAGVCGADMAGYPDCRPDFIHRAQQAITTALDELVEIYTPLIFSTKAGTFELAEQLGILELILEDTHTCYEGNREKRYEWGYGCGKCPACQERARGWEQFSGVVA